MRDGMLQGSAKIHFLRGFVCQCEPNWPGFRLWLRYTRGAWGFMIEGMAQDEPRWGGLAGVMMGVQLSSSTDQWRALHRVGGHRIVFSMPLTPLSPCFITPTMPPPPYPSHAINLEPRWRPCTAGGTWPGAQLMCTITCCGGRPCCRPACSRSRGGGWAWSAVNLLALWGCMVQAVVVLAPSFRACQTLLPPSPLRVMKGARWAMQ